MGPRRENILGRELRVIAIDGPVAAGKTVVGRELARRLGFRCMDTGMMYRAITWLALRCGIAMDDEPALGALADRTPIRFNDPDDQRVLAGEHEVGPELRETKVDSHVSLVARVPRVRRALVRQQQALAQGGKIVMVGRDIGTVVLPDADLKVFMLASAEERAGRRWRDLQAQGLDADFQQVLRETKARDDVDSHRTDSPLTPAKDAIFLDTEGRSVNQVVELILQQVHQLSGTPER